MPSSRDEEDEEAEYRRRRRTDFMDEVGEESDYVKNFYDNQKNPNGAVGAVFRWKIGVWDESLNNSYIYVFRRKRYNDLKSVQERKDESKQIESWLNM